MLELVDSRETFGSRSRRVDEIVGRAAKRVDRPHGAPFFGREKKRR